MRKLLLIVIVALAACNSNKPTPPFNVLKVAKTKEGAIMDVQLQARLTRQQLLDIAGNLRNDSSQYAALQIDFLLPGSNYENLGGVNVYAEANYQKPGIVTAKDTVRDYDNKILGFEFIGFTPETAKHLLSLEPTDMAGKTVLGKFIDDATQTMSIIYNDKKDDQHYILELDVDGKVVSAVQPMTIIHDGVQKMVVTAKGDFMTLKDSTLSMYSIDQPDKPFRTLKKGI